ncbi:macrophage mannose receptor 1-like [Antedon mediterranea]|uniref:macrophage mannose receptor 1-like n=1 Tax=Antedon mediterranea TaxID=105859 RepID=UPI003AF8C217
MRPILAIIGFVALATACEDGWESYNGYCYLFNQIGGNRNYADSEVFCLNHGAHLVSIHSEAENDFVTRTARDLDMGNTWIGLDDNGHENEFTYLDGTPFYRGGYTRGEPNNHGAGQDCSYFPFGPTPYGWDDLDCSRNSRFVCEKNVECEEGWITWGQNGHCYKFFPEEMIYAQAKARCTEEGGYLVSITTDDENTFVIRNVAIEISGSERPPRTWVGLDDTDTEGLWHYADELDTESFVGRFSRGEPNNAGSGQNCVWFPFREDDAWDDVSCGAQRKAVCKKPDFQQMATSCSGNWLSYGDSCYKFDNTQRNYAASEEYCTTQGGHMVSIHNDAENAFVIDKAQELDLRNTWIGLDDNGHENVFTFLDGTDFFRGGYTRGEPNDWGGNQDCSYFPFRETYGWDDMRCSNSAQYICENVAPCAAGWTENQGHCYKRYSDSVDYPTAKASCIGHGGYILAITTPEENEYVYDNIQDDPSSDPPTTWVGIDDMQYEGRFTLAEPGNDFFNGRFSRGEPNNAGSGQNCAWFPFRDPYSWDDISCEAQRSVVCKKPDPARRFADDMARHLKDTLLHMRDACFASEQLTVEDDTQNMCEKVEEVINTLIEDCGGGANDE